MKLFPEDMRSKSNHSKGSNKILCSLATYHRLHFFLLSFCNKASKHYGLDGYSLEVGDVSSLIFRDWHRHHFTSELSCRRWQSLIWTLTKTKRCDHKLSNLTHGATANHKTQTRSPICPDCYKWSYHMKNSCIPAPQTKDSNKKGQLLGCLLTTTGELIK